MTDPVVAKRFRSTGLGPGSRKLARYDISVFVVPALGGTAPEQALLHLEGETGIGLKTVDQG